MVKKARMLVALVLIAVLLAACGASDAQRAGESFVAETTAALDAVPGVVGSTVDYTDPGSMAAVVNVRVAAAPAAELENVLDDSLRAVASTSGSLKPVTRVEFYVFPAGDEAHGIRPDVLGLGQTPTVNEIGNYAAKG